jgi:hypothetical protein
MSNDLVGASTEVFDLMASAQVRRALPGVEAIDFHAAPSAGTEFVEVAGGSGNRFGTITFEFANAGTANGLPPSIAWDEFKADFCRDAARLQRWAAEAGWPARAIPELNVVVSDGYEISKSLVPAWSGRAGHMEFPARRVIAREAAIMHELVHVFFPNGNRFLAEGLAVYLQAALGGNPAFPNFGKPLHEHAGSLFLAAASGGSCADKHRLARCDLAELDAIATPNRLRLPAVREHDGQQQQYGSEFTYPVAGSFVKFLIETQGIDRFRTLYLQTPLVPLVKSAGASDRWLGVYGVALDALGVEWDSMIVSEFAVADGEEVCGGRIEAQSIDNSPQPET